MDLVTLIIWFAVCALQDARQREVSNWLTWGAFAAALGYLGFYGQTWLGAAGSEGGWALLLCLVLTLPGYLLNRLGAADVKLLMALALATDRLILLGTIIGAGLALVLWVFAGQKIYNVIVQRLNSTETRLNGKKSKKHPFVPFLFMGMVMAITCLH
jgi:prepilin peptidase CpaA